jgi:catechol 2,3-dioxygenase-like lactoylglutathione lyase family enzyme
MNMKFHSPMIIVADITRSKKFYTDVLSEEVTLDLGSYVVFGGGFSMMSREQWNTLTKDTATSGNSGANEFELYFEDDGIEDFVRQLEKHPDVEKFTPLEETPWHQRTIHFFDPDRHVVEVAESMKAVVKRLLSSGMPPGEVSEKSMMPMEFVQKCGAEL